MSFKKNNKGFSIIEILVAIFIIAITLTSLLGLTSSSLKTSILIKETTQSVNLAQEAMEAVRSIRDGDWNKITNGNHGLTSIGGYWDFDGTENIINSFSRTILIENTQRDTNDNIVENGGTNDPDTKKIIVTVSWKNKETELVTYLTNWK